jgi:hypothetical protein
MTADNMPPPIGTEKHQKYFYCIGCANWNAIEMHLVCVTCVPPENSHLEWTRFPKNSDINGKV